MPEEPSVLDYVKSRLMPWKASALDASILEENVEADLPDADRVAAESVALEKKRVRSVAAVWPWRALLAFFLALVAQRSLEPQPDRTWMLGVILYLISFAWVIWANYIGEWPIAPIPTLQLVAESLAIRPVELGIGAFLGLLVFLTSGGNRFSWINLFLLVISLGFLIRAFWVLDSHLAEGLRRFRARLSRRSFSIPVWGLVVLGVLALGLFFRFYHLSQTPLEMNSDHAEKILDVSRLLQGQTNIFFPNNGGREAMQMYLVAGLHKLFGLKLDFLTLKLSTALIGALSLPFLYLLGKELANRRVGLLALAFAGVAYWPNLISRVGLRLPFYVLFTAATLFFLLRGLRTAQRNYFLFAGITLGLSFYGYSADRILPLVVVAAVGLFLIHKQSAGYRPQVALSLGMLALISAVIFLPMLRYSIDEPDSFLFRTLSRIGTAERPLPGPAWQIFLGNLGRAMAMFSWSNGEVWTLSVPYRPALEVASGALFWMGFMLVFLRYLKQRNWVDIFLVLSIPLLMLPSIMSLAFPAENPNLYRTGGALIPVFLLVGLALDGLMTSFEQRLANIGKTIAWGLAIFLLIWSGMQSFNLVFDQYDQQYKLSSWNSSEMGQVVHNFAQTMGNIEQAWVIAYPYWVDTRLVGMMAGYPDRNFAILAEDIPGLPSSPGAKLFLFKPEDQAALEALKRQFPQGWLQLYESQVETKDFYIYIVPPETDL